LCSNSGSALTGPVRLRLQVEHAIELLNETGGAANTAKVVEACHMIGATQLMQGLLDYGDEAVKKQLLDNNPDGYIRILNLVCRLADSGLRYDKFHHLVKQVEPNQVQSSPIKP
jgi:hypothetical protein